MTLEQRIEHLERLVAAQGEVIETLTTTATNMYNVLVELQTTNERQIVVNETTQAFVGQLSADRSFQGLMFYWLLHFMQEIDHVVPAGTVDLMLNTVEESLDPSDATFYDMWNDLRGTSSL
ncbi:hypothetical protein SAMN06295905_1083 [Devosia lucknowensis]|uniref:Uncharacterized protein n=1 Tax=Devosia lucknowensis TaxID=1096929 RepID=A0A1Y6EQA3_9HYPH|nr:hypothetical protein [Devosia lucknowensis]SMQ64878.1 hypothetical protein SAMN06295905_1083 [Devosia lucknowensis]